MEASYATVLDRIEQVLAQHPDLADSRAPSQQEIDDLYTDACATVLLLEGERKSIERRIAAAQTGSHDDPETIRDTRDLARRRAQIDDSLVALRALADGLGAAAGGARRPDNAA